MLRCLIGRSGWSGARWRIYLGPQEWAWGVRGFGALNMVWLPPHGDHVYPVPLLPGGCQALRTEDFLNFAEYDPGTRHIGSEGEEQSLRCWLLGYQVVVQPRVVVCHHFRDHLPYEVQPGELI